MGGNEKTDGMRVKNEEGEEGRKRERRRRRRIKFDCEAIKKLIGRFKRENYKCKTVVRQGKGTKEKNSGRRENGSRKRGKERRGREREREARLQIVGNLWFLLKGFQ